MEMFWIQNQYGILIFLIVVFLITFTNWFALKRLGTYPRLQQLPFVSVLIPARNEETNILRCVSSLLEQDYPDFELIVLEDGSTDRTADILAELQLSSSRLRVITGRQLPEGWLGKSWACHQLAGVANGDYLLFTDADTRHQPGTIREAMEAMVAERADLLTMLPREEIITWGEKWFVPLLGWSILSYLPLVFNQYRNRPFFSYTIGQFMLFRKKAYRQIGGHAAIRDNAADDMALGKRLRIAGLHWLILDGTDRVDCRMYHNLSETLNGFTKNLFPAFGYNVTVFILIWLWIGWVYLYPPTMSLVCLLGRCPSWVSLPVTVISIVLGGGSWVLAYARLRVPVVLAFVYPFIVISWVFVAFRSLIYTILGKTHWKDRKLVRHKIYFW